MVRSMTISDSRSREKQMEQSKWHSHTSYSRVLLNWDSTIMHTRTKPSQYQSQCPALWFCKENKEGDESHNEKVELLVNCWQTQLPWEVYSSRTCLCCSSVCQILFQSQEVTFKCNQACRPISPWYQRRRTHFQTWHNKSFNCYIETNFCGLWNPDTAIYDPMTSKSRSGFIIMYAGCPVMSSSNLQTETALSTTKAQYILASKALQNVLPLMNLLQEAKDYGIDIPAPDIKMLSTLHRQQRNLWVDSASKISTTNKAHQHSLTSFLKVSCSRPGHATIHSNRPKPSRHADKAKWHHSLPTIPQICYRSLTDFPLTFLHFSYYQMRECDVSDTCRTSTGSLDMVIMVIFNYCHHSTHYSLTRQTKTLIQ